MTERSSQALIATKLAERINNNHRLVPRTTINSLPNTRNKLKKETSLAIYISESMSNDTNTRIKHINIHTT